ncbi:hypothetical protein B0H13DRAFT_1901185 [Mycena leptocephala]|nr:hypothetical protein B0H13DRAFT_1901185 [Mycena leptocephala]
MTADSIPESTLPYPPVYKDKRFVVLSDYLGSLSEGTITTRDSNDFMTDNLGYGKERRAGNLEIFAGRQTFRDGFREMLENIVANGHSFGACKEELRKNIKLDAGFKHFNAWCSANDIPIVIVSSGMAPSIRAVLSNLIGDEIASFPTRWISRLTASGTSSFTTSRYNMSAARHADVLFVNQTDDGENDLAAFCTREGIKHIIFRDFAQALGVVQAVASGEKTPVEVLATGKA